MWVPLFLITSTALAAPVVHWAKVPLNFEPNAGQAPVAVSYLARSNSGTLSLTRESMVFDGHDQTRLRTELVGVNPAAHIAGESRLDSTTN